MITDVIVGNHSIDIYFHHAIKYCILGLSLVNMSTMEQFQFRGKTLFHLKLADISNAFMARKGKISLLNSTLTILTSSR